LNRPFRAVGADFLDCNTPVTESTNSDGCFENRVSKVGRMLNKQAKHACVWMVACTAVAVVSTGCRNMSGRGMFGWRGEPSAETLAGSGPTVTYPAPPSESATPEAIASIAGGTAVPSNQPQTPSSPGAATAQVAGINVTPGYATPAANLAPSSPPPSTPTNLAAALANGIVAPGGAAAPGGGYKKTSPLAAKPSGYTFGSKPSAAATAGSTATGSIDALSSGSDYTPPATSYTRPLQVKPSGFAMPSDAPAIATISLPSATPPGSKPAADSSTNFAPPPAAAPSFSTASTASLSAPAPTSQPARNSGGGNGYMPGSTGTASGYPLGEAVPTTSGSMFR
jgi:hypothetical protein